MATQVIAELTERFKQPSKPKPIRFKTITPGFSYYNDLLITMVFNKTLAEDVLNSNKLKRLHKELDRLKELYLLIVEDGLVITGPLMLITGQLTSRSRLSIRSKIGYIEDEIRTINKTFFQYMKDPKFIELTTVYAEAYQHTLDAKDKLLKISKEIYDILKPGDFFERYLKDGDIDTVIEGVIKSLEYLLFRVRKDFSNSRKLDELAELDELKFYNMIDDVHDDELDFYRKTVTFEFLKEANAFSKLDKDIKKHKQSLKTYIDSVSQLKIIDDHYKIYIYKHIFKYSLLKMPLKILIENISTLLNEHSYAKLHDLLYDRLDQCDTPEEVYLVGFTYLSGYVIKKMQQVLIY